MPRRTPVPDLCVIGGGTAGHAVALAAAALGARCVLVDPRPRLGQGQAADLADSMLFAAAGAHAPGTPFDLVAFRRRLGQAITVQAPLFAAARLRSAGVEIVCGGGVFTDPRTLMAAGRSIRARRFVLATGVPEPEAASAAAGWRPVDLFTREPVPARLKIRAATPAGLEWAQALARLGTAVTLVLQRGATEPFAPEAIAPCLAALQRDGVRIVPDGTEAQDPDRRHTLVLGRPLPASAALGLAAAGIEIGNGAPVVDRLCRTSNRRVFAIGDVLGQPAPGGAAIPSQVGTVLRAALFRQTVGGASTPAPRTLRTQPAVAQVGVLSGEAAHRVLRAPLRAIAPGDAAGGVTIVSTAAGRILGVSIVGDGAADAIVPWTLAIAQRIPVGAMAGLSVPADSAAEGARRAALGFVTARLREPWIKRLIGWVRYLP